MSIHTIGARIRAVFRGRAVAASYTGLSSLLLALLSAVPHSTIHAQIVFGPERVITNTLDHSRGIYFGDLDGDGDSDIIGTAWSSPKVTWYENLGGGRFGPENLISTDVIQGESVFPADLDADGDLDILSASRGDDKVAWYENLGGGLFGPQQVISTEADEPIDVRADDLNGDGLPDVLVASLTDNSISWFVNKGSGFFGARQIIWDQALRARHVHTEDLDADGDVDVLSASFKDSTISWFENLGAGTFSTERILSDSAADARWVCTADLDGDGDPDALSASRLGSEFAWYENLGSGIFGPERLISKLGDGARGIDAGDFDGDGDLDVVGGSEFDDDIAIYENLGGGNFARERLLSGFSDGAWKVYATDLDLDGDTDILAAVVQEDKIVWFENLQGQARPDQFRLVEVAWGLTRPVDLAAPIENRMFVAEKAGTVAIVDLEEEKLLDTPFLDIGDRVLVSGNDYGLLSLAFPKNFAAKGLFYVHYSAFDGSTRISRFSVDSGNPDIADPASEEILLTIPAASGQRLGGDMNFSPDGYLCIALGDGGDPAAAQDPASFRGKMLRLDVSTASGYGIPSDNPYLGDPSVPDEIWLSGLRDPRQFSFDARKKHLFLPDVNAGPDQELNIILSGPSSGLNLGWPCMSGAAPGPGPGCGSGASFRAPDLSYMASISPGSVTGGYVYRGPSMPGYQGAYFFTDAFSGDWYVMRSTPSGPIIPEVIRRLRADISAFGEDGAGELYALDEREGKLLKVAVSCAWAGPPAGLRHVPYDSVSMRLYWSAVHEAVAYRVRVRQPGATVHDALIDRGLFTFGAADLIPGQTYIWNVRPRCADASFGPFSETDTFSMPVFRTPGPLAFDDLIEESGDRLLVVQQSGDRFRIEAPEPLSGSSSLRVFDLQGRLRFYSEMTGAAAHSVECATWPPGIYFVSWSDGNQALSTRFVLQR